MTSLDTVAGGWEGVRGVRRRWRRWWVDGMACGASGRGGGELEELRGIWRRRMRWWAYGTACGSSGVVGCSGGREKGALGLGVRRGAVLSHASPVVSLILSHDLP
jgi:hypothetical protein